MIGRVFTVIIYVNDTQRARGRSFTHKAGGDLATQTIAASSDQYDYSYDARGHLAGISLNGAGLVTQAYDHAGRRVLRSQGGQGVAYIYDAAGHLLAEHDGASGAVIREYIWLEGMVIAMVAGAPAAPTYSFVHTGHLDEPLLVTDGSGAVASSITRDPWGNAILLAGTAAIRLGYPGQWHDGASGLYQNWNRDYDPTTGRYIQTDPIGLAGGTNLYAYVGGNPVNAIDPEGLRSKESIAVEETLRRALPKVALEIAAKPSRKIPLIGQALLVGDILGSAVAVAKFCYDHANGDDPDEDGPCEIQKREDELECNQWHITGGGAGLTRRQGYALCMQSVMVRYGECRSRGMNPGRITTPLFLPTGRRGGPDHFRSRR